MELLYKREGVKNHCAIKMIVEGVCKGYDNIGIVLDEWLCKHICKLYLD